MIRESLFFVIKFDFASCCQKPFLAFQNEVVIIELLDHAVPSRVFIYFFIYLFIYLFTLCLKLNSFSILGFSK